LRIAIAAPQYSLPHMPHGLWRCPLPRVRILCTSPIFEPQRIAHEQHRASLDDHPQRRPEGQCAKLLGERMQTRLRPLQPWLLVLPTLPSLVIGCEHVWRVPQRDPRQMPSADIGVSSPLQ
jgi:hypothetical protein